MLLIGSTTANILLRIIWELYVKEISVMNYGKDLIELIGQVREQKKKFLNARWKMFPSHYAI